MIDVTASLREPVALVIMLTTTYVGGIVLGIRLGIDADRGVRARRQTQEEEEE